MGGMRSFCVVLGQLLSTARTIFYSSHNNFLLQFLKKKFLTVNLLRLNFTTIPRPVSSKTSCPPKPANLNMLQSLPYSGCKMNWMMATASKRKKTISLLWHVGWSRILVAQILTKSIYQRWRLLITDAEYTQIYTALRSWLRNIGCQFLFPRRFHDRSHISTHQYGRLVWDWVVSIGLKPSGTAPILCAEQRWRKSIARLGICALFSFCSATRRLIVQSGIWESS